MTEDEKAYQRAIMLATQAKFLESYQPYDLKHTPTDPGWKSRLLNAYAKALTTTVLFDLTTVQAMSGQLGAVSYLDHQIVTAQGAEVPEILLKTSTVPVQAESRLTGVIVVTNAPTDPFDLVELAFEELLLHLERDAIGHQLQAAATFNPKEGESLGHRLLRTRSLIHLRSQRSPGDVVIGTPANILKAAEAVAKTNSERTIREVKLGHPFRYFADEMFPQDTLLMLRSPTSALDADHITAPYCFVPDFESPTKLRLRWRGKEVTVHPGRALVIKL